MAQSQVDVTSLQTLSTKDVLELWKEVVGSPPPCVTSREFLVAMVAWHQQAKKYGGLSHQTQRALKGFKQRDSRSTLSRQSVLPTLPVGTVLLKTYQGTRYTVTVQAEGFVFEGTVYGNLSEIARRMTGTRWNGPAFFGLRTRPKKRSSQKGQDG
jgi:hypothetical protein